MELSREDESCEAFIKGNSNGAKKLNRLRNVLLLLLTLLALVGLLTITGYFVHSLMGAKQADYRKFTLEAEPIVDLTSEIFRLPVTFKPIHYNLTIQPHFADLIFDASVQLQLLSLTPTQTITLNCLNLRIREVKLYRDGKQLAIRSVQLQPIQQTMSIECEDLLSSGSTVLVSINYTGRIYDGLSFPFGFFLSKYGEGQLVAVTQLAFLYARTVYPCLDEPSLKATFQLTLIRPAQYSTVSNTHLLSTRPHSLVDNTTWMCDTFAKTPQMSTYLLAFAYHQFQNFTRWTARQIPVTLWVADDKDIQPHLARIAERIVASVDFFEYYLNQPYSLRKFDFIYVPHLAQGAMENWGLVVIHEFLIRYTSIARHEVAHQWLGNIITCRWWDDLWLHESLVTFLVAKVENSDGDYSKLPSVGEILRSEAVAPVAPIGSEVKYHSDLSFRARYMKESLYEKGTYLINTIFELIGPAQFQQLLKELVAEHKYSSLDRSDFYKLVERHSQLPYSAQMIIEPYLIRPGFPLITVERKPHLAALKLAWYSHSEGLTEYCGKNVSFVIPIRLNSTSRLQKRIRLARNGTSRVTHDLVVSNQWYWLQPNRTNFITVTNEEILPNFHLSTYALLQFSSIGDLSDTLQVAGKSLSMASLTYRRYLTKCLFIGAEIGLIPYGSIFTQAHLWSQLDTVRLELIRIHYQLKHTPVHSLWMEKVLFPLFRTQFDDFPRTKKRLLVQHYVSHNRTIHTGRLSEISALICFEGYKPCYQQQVDNLQTYLDHSNESQMLLGSIQFCTAIRYAPNGLVMQLYQKLFSDNNTDDHIKFQLLCNGNQSLIAHLYHRLSQHNYADAYLENKLLSTLIRTPIGVALLWDKLEKFSSQPVNLTEPTEGNRILQWILVRLGDWQDLKLAELISWLTPEKVLKLYANLQVSRVNHETMLKLNVLKHLVSYRSQWLSQHYVNIEKYVDQLN